MGKILSERATCGKVEQTKELPPVGQKAKKVFDHTKAGNGGCKCNLQNKIGLRCSSQRDEEPRLEGEKAAWGMRAALCPSLM